MYMTNKLKQEIFEIISCANVLDLSGKIQTIKTKCTQFNSIPNIKISTIDIINESISKVFPFFEYISFRGLTFTNELIEDFLFILKHLHFTSFPLGNLTEDNYSFWYQNEYCLTNKEYPKINTKKYNKKYQFINELHVNKFFEKMDELYQFLFQYDKTGLILKLNYALNVELMYNLHLKYYENPYPIKIQFTSISSFINLVNSKENWINYQNDENAYYNDMKYVINTNMTYFTNLINFIFGYNNILTTEVVEIVKQQFIVQFRDEIVLFLDDCLEFYPIYESSINEHELNKKREFVKQLYLVCGRDLALFPL